MHDAKRIPDLWVFKASKQAASAISDISGTITERLKQYEFQQTIQHKRAARPIPSRFFAECGEQGS
jgi:hypothetical protein